MWVPVRASNPQLTEEEAKKIAASDYEGILLKGIANLAGQLANQKLSNDMARELTPEGHIVNSVDAVKAYAARGLPAEDHFVLLAHAGGRLRDGGSAPEIGIGTSHYAWSSHEIAGMFKAFRGRCLDLTLYVCYVSADVASQIAAQTKTPVYHSNSLLKYSTGMSYGIYRSVAPWQFDPTLTNPKLERVEPAEK